MIVDVDEENNTSVKGYLWSLSDLDIEYLQSLFTDEITRAYNNGEIKRGSYLEVLRTKLFG